MILNTIMATMSTFDDHSNGDGDGDDDVGNYDDDDLRGWRAIAP